MGYVFAADSIIMSCVPSFPCSGPQKHMRAVMYRGFVQHST